MAALRNKRGRDKYWNGGLALPDAKRTNSVRSVQDSDLMALREKIDYLDVIKSCNPEEIRPAIQLEDERLNGVKKSPKVEVGMTGRADEVESVDVDEKGCSIKQITGWNPEATSTSASDTGYIWPEGNLTYYDDVREELGFFVDHTAVELGIIMNLIDWDSIATMYSDGVHGYSETVYGSLWENDIWQLNGHSVDQNDFESAAQNEFGIIGTDFHDDWNDFRPIHRVSTTIQQGL